MSVSVHVYRHRNLQVRYTHFIEILLTFVKSVNGSNFPVKSLTVLKGKISFPMKWSEKGPNFERICLLPNTISFVLLGFNKR